ncbi:GNAT family N-acetyltransferase [Hymenobacter yonginensis]|uniref:ATP-grasp domain-containing protein n=1 Tax=Hymenobacter yonginensis TaxID=748197 RepID=A0ABY7PSR7_9BACT|nr:GNAT family N-acetyltransferase [Hymenobacter yonginensis]WBO85669.1 ATP-grasp domain-containing protein [Hymenobacter yonginensis]
MNGTSSQWPTAYQALSRQQFEHQGYTLLPIRDTDQEAIRQWRNDQIDILRQREPLTAQAQAQYFTQVVRPLFAQPEPSQLLFSFLQGGRLIGYGGLVHIDWQAGRAEISFLLETSRNQHVAQFQQDFTVYLRLLREAAFEATSLCKLNTEAYDIRPYLTQVLEAEGFVLEARLHEHVSVAGRRVDTLIHSCFRPTQPAGTPAPVVLITSIARKVPLIQAVRNALRRFHNGGQLLGADSDPACIGRYFTDDFWHMPIISEENLPAILAWCQERQVTHLIPTRDGELLFWSRHHEQLAEHGISVLVAPMQGVETCLDKLRFAEVGRQHGLPVIPAATRLEDIGAKLLVVKERRGAGSRSLGLRLSPPEAAAHAGTLQEPIFQPYVAGTEISVDAYVTRQGRVHGLVLRTRDVVLQGESQVTTTFEDAVLAAQLQAAIEALGIRGHVVMQAILDDRRQPHIIECNCRFGGASSVAVAQGLDSFFWFFLESAGHSLSAFPFKPHVGGLRQVRYPADLLRPAPLSTT